MTIFACQFVVHSKIRGRGKQQVGEHVHYDKATWDTNTTELFLKSVIKQISLNNRPLATLSELGYTGLHEDMSKATGKRYKREQLRNKYNDLRQDWIAWEFLRNPDRGTTGVGWDSALGTFVQQYENDHVRKNPCYTGERTGELWVRELIQAHEKRPIHSLRMPGQVFLELCSILVNKYNLPVQNRGLLVEERVAMFVMTLAHGWPCRETQENFQHSSETVHRQFYGVMRAMLAFSRDMCKPKNDERQRKHYLKRKPNYAVFKDCVGAIDGTHIKCVPPENRVPWFGRKACYTQNVLAVCDFNMRFTFVSAGWEGSMHDTNVFNRVINEPTMHFPIPETGKYYLADAGYPCRVGFLGPYKGQRYHFQEFRGIENQMNVKEKFNHAHSSLRGIIERSFGVLKERFQILDKMPPVNIMVQAQIVSVAMALHNFIREIATKDAFFDDADMNEDYEYVDELDLHDTGPPEQCEEGDNIQMVQLRDQLASLLVQRAARRNR